MSVFTNNTDITGSGIVSVLTHPIALGQYQHIVFKSYLGDDAVSASVIIWVPKLGESESGQMVSEKKWNEHNVMYIYHKQCEILQKNHQNS